MVIKSFAKGKHTSPFFFLTQHNTKPMKTFELTEEIYDLICKEYKETGQEMFDQMFILSNEDTKYDDYIGGYQ